MSAPPNEIKLPPMTLPDITMPPPGSGSEPPPLPRKPAHLRRLHVPSSPRGAEAWRADAMRNKMAGPSEPSAPPLPPKPSYARAADVSTDSASPPPPPLPPKPAYARAEPKPVLPFRPDRPPTRPLPPIPDLGLAATNTATGSETSAPPERSIVSDALPLPVEPRPFHVDSDLLSAEDPNDIPSKLETPVAPPLCSLCHATLPSIFGELPLRKRDVFSLPPHNIHDVRSAAAAGLGGKRRRRRNENIVPVTLTPALSGAEFGPMLNECVRDARVGKIGRSMQVLVGFVVNTIVAQHNEGRNLFAQAVSRLRDNSAPLVRCSAFTFIGNVAAQSMFVRGRVAGDVENLSRLMFADVILAMRATEKEREVWDSAVRSALQLFSNSEITPTNLQREALLAIVASLEPHRHPDLTATLFEFADREFGEVKKSTHFYRDVETTVQVYSQTSSLSARRKLFRAILYAAVDDALQMNEGSWSKPADVEEQTRWLLAMLEAHDAGNALVLEFIKGAQDDFVWSLTRQIFVAPLLKSSGQGDEDVTHLGNSEEDDLSSRWGRTAVPFSNDGSEVDSTARAFDVSTKRYARAVRTANSVLHKPFVLRVLQALKRLADAAVKIQPNVGSAADEAVQRALEATLGLRRCERAERPAVEAAKCLRAMHDAAATLVGVPGAAGAALRVAELLLETILLAPAFAHPDLNTGDTDTVAAQFLAGRRYAVRRMLGDVDVALLLACLAISEPRWADSYASLVRQCLIELVGAAERGAALAAPFVDDPDPAVAYRAGVVYAAGEDSGSDAAPATPRDMTREMLRRARAGGVDAFDDAFAKALLFKDVVEPL